MQGHKLLLALILFILGFIGILSTLSMELPLPEETKALLLEQFTPGQLQWIMLLNPSILLIIAITIGTLFYKQAGLRVPLIEALVKRETMPPVLPIINTGISYGIITGLLLLLLSAAFISRLPEAFIELGENIKPTLLARFLYGGITEEILMRFGLMSFLVFLVSKVTKKLNAATYWTGILLAALLFALGHFPVAYMAVEQPSAFLLTYILLGNAVGGIVFGWVYWRRGLEAAMIAHIFAHVMMVIGEPLIPQI